MQMNLLKEYIRQVLLESTPPSSVEGVKTWADLGRWIASKTGGAYVWKSNPSRNVKQTRLSVEDKDALKGRSEQEVQDIIKGWLSAAGFKDPEVVLPGASVQVLDDYGPLSRKLEGYKLELKPGLSFKPESTMQKLHDDGELYVTFSSATATPLEDKQLSALGEEFMELAGPEGMLKLVPDPLSDSSELKAEYLVGAPVNVSGTPKADIMYPGDKPVWVSLKGGTTAKDFQQWGGMSTKDKLDIVRKFVRDIIKVSTVEELFNKEGEKTGVQINLGKEAYPSRASTSLWRGLVDVDNDIKQKVYYGDDATEGKDFGKDKVHIIIQGNPQDLSYVRQGDGVYTVTGVNKYSFPQIPDAEYTPVMYARRQSDAQNLARFVSESDFDREEDKEKYRLIEKDNPKGVRLLFLSQDKMPGTAKELNDALGQVGLTVKESRTMNALQTLIHEMINSHT